MVFFLLFFQRLYFSLLGDKDKKNRIYYQKSEVFGCRCLPTKLANNRSTSFGVSLGDGWGEAAELMLLPRTMQLPRMLRWFRVS